MKKETALLCRAVFYVLPQALLKKGVTAVKRGGGACSFFFGFSTG
jgi:hypothetical protein